MRMEKIDTRQFVTEVQYATGDVKSSRHHTAKAARHEAKRLAGATNVSWITLVDYSMGCERVCLWRAS